MAAQQVVANNDIMQELGNEPGKDSDASKLVWIGSLWAHGTTSANLYFNQYKGTPKHKKRINPQQLWPRIMNSMTHNDVSLLEEALKQAEDGPWFFDYPSQTQQQRDMRLQRKGIVKAAIKAKIAVLEPIRKQWEEQRTLLLDGFFQAQIPQAKIPKVVSKTLAAFTKEGGRKSRKSNKAVRKHRGIVQTGGKAGKLKKGYRYSGKRLKNGKPEIIKNFS